MTPVSRKLLSALALMTGAVFGSSTRANAQVVDFQVGTAGSCFAKTCFAEGFQFDFVAEARWGISDDGNTDFNRDGNASTGMLGAYGDFFGNPVTVTMSKVGGGTFSVLSFLAAEGDPSSFAFFGSPTIVTGFLAGGGTVTAPINLFQEFTSYSLTGFDDLTSIVFSNDDLDAPTGVVGIGLDDIVTSSTPEPASIALVATGLVGLVAIRRKRK